MNQILCPNCGGSQVSNVEGIVLQQTSEADVPVMRALDWWRDTPDQRYHVETFREIRTTTALAKQLLPPDTLLGLNIKAAPNPDEVETALLQQIQTPAYGVGIWIGVIVDLIGFLMLMFVLSGSTKTNIPAGILLGLFCLGPILIAVGIMIAVFFDRKRKRSRVDRTNMPEHIRQKVAEARARFDEFDRQVRKLAMARQRYARLYYCSTCNRVFDPEDPRRRALPLNMLEDYIWTL